jgi:mannose-6-phosphate isomerase-like protein (cupin superfamily)
MATTAFDPFATFVHLRAKGEVNPVPWTPGFWRELTTADGEPSECEMHPCGDELLYLLSGSVDVVFEEPEGDRAVPLRGGEACIVPRGVWHRIVMHAPADLLFVTPPKGTELRPARGR